MTCQTCGSEKQENYCPQCGEKKFDPHSLSLKHVIEEGIEGFTHADHNIFHTLKALFFKPGQLTLDYVEGRRVKFMKPLGLFLVINLVFFLVPSNNVISQPLETFLEYRNYLTFGTKEAVDNALLHTGETLEEFRKGFNTSMRASSKAYVILLVLIFTLVFRMLMLKKKRTIIEHLIFSLHFVSFVLLFFLLEYLIAFPFIWIFGDEFWQFGDRIFGFVVMAFVGVYLSLAFKRFYNVKTRWSVTAALFSTLLFTVVIMGYRLFLFYKIVLLAH